MVTENAENDSYGLDCTNHPILVIDSFFIRSSPKMNKPLYSVWFFTYSL